MPIYRKEKLEWTKDGRSYYFRCYYKDLYGNRKQKESKLYKTKLEAKDAEIEFLSKIKTTDEINNNILFIDVYKEWLLFKQSQVKSTTFYSVVKRCEYHILPYFKKYRLHSIKMNTINQWKDKIFSLNITTGHKNTLIRTLKEILIYARDNYEYDIKIVSKIQLYKVENVVDKTNAEINFWTFEEFSKFISAVDNKFYYLIFNFLYYTGLRLGEMIALTWDDINFDRKQIRINKTFTNKVLDCSYKITTPKTSNSVRYVDLDDALLSLMKKYYEEEKRIYNFNKEMFIFGNITHVSPTTIKRYLYKYIELADVKKITPHGFRHSHVSLLINLGCDSRDVAERIGDTIQMVEKTYYHMFPTKKKETVNLLNSLKTRGK